MMDVFTCFYYHPLLGFKHREIVEKYTEKCSKKKLGSNVLNLTIVNSSTPEHRHFEFK